MSTVSSAWLKRFFLIVLVALLGLYLSRSPVLAGTLTIEVQASLSVNENSVTGTITVRNRGDEPARKVHAELLVPGETVVKEIAERLDVQQKASFTFQKSLGKMKPGTYAIPVTIIFHDMKLYPFSALACPTFTVGEVSSPAISCSTTPLEGGGKIEFHLRNLDPFAKQVKTSFLFPREFYCPRPEISLTLEPMESKEIPFSILRATAIPGARYPVFSIIAVETEKAHHSLVCTSEIRFLEQGNWFRRTRWYWLGGWLLLIASSVGEFIRKKR
jgi:hypothetical protein